MPYGVTAGMIVAQLDARNMFKRSEDAVAYANAI
jgi:hypothetical protein